MVRIQTQGLVDAERLREALHHLRQAGDRGITKAQLAKKLGDVAVRTVDRAIRLLEAQGAKLKKTRKGRPPVLFFELVKGPSWDEHVSLEARLALKLAALSLERGSTLLWEEKFRILERLASEHMSSRDRDLFETLQRAVRVQGGVDDPIETPNALEPVLRALEGKKALEVTYRSVGRKAATVRTVVPYSMNHDLYSGGTFLLVWDYGRRKPLMLRWSRIDEVRVVPMPDPLPPTALDLLEQACSYQIGGWTREDPPFEVVARIEGAHWVQALQEAPPALPNFETRKLRGEQALEVRFKATHPAGASRWILQFGEAAEVLEPAWLREEIHQRLETACQRYR